MQLTSCQQTAADAFSKFLMSDDKEFVLAGAGGCGKSFLTKHLIDLADKQCRFIKLIGGNKADLNVSPTATTNKAAAVLKDAIHMDSVTIHSLLGLRVMNDFKTGGTYLKQTKNYEIQQDALIIIDEASMIDDNLLKMIRKSTKNCKVLYVGDKYQLAPVGSSTLPVFDGLLNQYELKSVVRQKAGSAIIQFAQGYRDALDTGKFPQVRSSGDEILQVDGATFQDMVDKEFALDHLNEENHAKILCWKNETVNGYNQYVRKLYTDSIRLEKDEYVTANVPLLDSNKRVFVKTDEIVKIDWISRIATEYGIDGAWFSIRGVDVFQPDNFWEAKQLLDGLARKKDWVNFFRMKELFADLRPVHACTVHKSQGSTYDKVFINLSDIGECRDWETVARMMYVAVSRAKKQVVLYGELPPKYNGGQS